MLWPLLLVAGIARANGIGDLYVGASSTVVEVHVAGQAIVNTVKTPSNVTSVAFSPDGHTLFAATGGRDIQVIDIETITLTGTLSAAGKVVAVAHPSGDRLAMAMPDLQRVSLVNPTDGTTTDINLQGPPDLVAADRREGIVLAAATTGGWVSLIDSALGTSHTIAVDGRVTGLALDRDTGGAYITTRSPNAVLRLDLATRKIAWKQSLGSAPTGVAATVAGAVVALDSKLVTATEQGVTPFETVPGSVVAVAGSDDGKVVVAATSNRVLAYASTGGDPKSQVGMAAGATIAAIAPVPKPILVGGTGTGAVASAKPSTAPAGGTGNAPKSPNKGGSCGVRAAASHPPVTSTDGGPANVAVTTPPVMGAALVATLIGGAWSAIYLTRERRRRTIRLAARAQARRLHEAPLHEAPLRGPDAHRY